MRQWTNSETLDGGQVQYQHHVSAALLWRLEPSFCVGLKATMDAEGSKRIFALFGHQTPLVTITTGLSLGLLRKIVRVEPNDN